MNDAPLWSLSATELLSRMEDGSVSSRAIIEACKARAESVDGRLNSLVHRFWSDALEQADAVDAARSANKKVGALAGLPVTIKESVETTPLPCTLGVENRLSSAVPREDAVVVQVIKEQGGIVVGKTNIPQLLIFNETDNAIWGRTNNPWNLERVPGGSSGGEGAALGAGIAALGVGTDIGGSIRVPAAYCGISGLKPTVDRWSASGIASGLPGQEIIRGQVGPMARTARDVALLFGAVTPQRQHELDPTVPPLPLGKLTPARKKDLVIGWFDDDGYLTPAASVQRGVHMAAEALEKKGFTVRRIQPESAMELLDTYYGALSADGTKTAQRQLGGDTVMPQLKNLFTMAKLPTAGRRALAVVMGLTGETRVQRLLGALGEKDLATYWQLTAKRTAIRKRVLRHWARVGVDIVLCPPHATPALRHGQSADFSVGGCYAMRYNFLNFPAGIVPVTTVRADETRRPSQKDRVEKAAAEAERGSEGLPVAVQVVGRPWQDGNVLRAMIALEDALKGNEDVPRAPAPLG